MLLVSLYGHMSGCLAVFHVGFGGHLAGHLGGHVAISHVYFGGCLGGHLSIKSVLHLIVVVLWWWSPALVDWSCCSILCLFGWSPSWLPVH